MAFVGQDLGFVPTVVICVNNFMALGVLRRLRERGLRVPQDVSVVGYDNIHLSEFTCPALTTVNVPRDRIGHRSRQPAPRPRRH
jgi:DNA-binding LacI/PurR family transcriptional regulator